MFVPIAQPHSAVDACAGALRDAILEGHAPVGSRLPPERELADQFGVNRVTVRSALGRLAAAGLVAVRQGSGYVVRDYRRVGGPDLVGALSELARRTGDPTPIARDLLFVRSCLAEGVLGRLAASPPTRAGLTKIAAAIDALERRVDQNATTAEIAEADVEVLGTILDATESQVLRLFLNPVTSLLRDLPDLCEALYAAPRENVLAFRALASWLEKPDARAVQAIVFAMRARDDDALARLAPPKRASRARPRTQSLVKAPRRGS